jgi:hypothetical protein
MLDEAMKKIRRLLAGRKGAPTKHAGRVYENEGEIDSYIRPIATTDPIPATSRGAFVAEVLFSSLAPPTAKGGRNQHVNTVVVFAQIEAPCFIHPYDECSTRGV